MSQDIDFSELIQFQNQELKRLQWSNEQGRDYLLDKYGKKSRQLLTEEEMLEFFNYLKSLPTPKN